VDRLRYETDPHNRLIVRSTGKKGSLVGFRRVLDGRFQLDTNNSLTYHIKEPLAADALCGRQVKFSGTWSLNKDHDLVYTLDSWQNQTSGDELTLRCQLIEAKEDSLVAALTTRSAAGNTSVYMLHLAGTWHVDDKNCLNMRLESRFAQPDSLTFESGWEVGKNKELVYRYEKKILSRRKRVTQSLAFKGHWDVSDKTRLGFALEPGNKPALIFSGSWKLSRTSGLSFEMKQRGGRVASVSLSAKVRLSKHDTILCTLKDSALSRSVGAELELTRDILGRDGQAFLLLLASKREQGIFVGMGRSW
jgi:hypothetical protein